MLLCCISSVSYIKPQPDNSVDMQHNVVYRPFPTSNHNLANQLRILMLLYIVRFLHQTTTTRLLYLEKVLLYIVRFLHQTTTPLASCFFASSLYIVRFLHQTTTNTDHLPFVRMLYIVRFLHQTTTVIMIMRTILRCISSVSYIKPQLRYAFAYLLRVVYRPFPTSNHNLSEDLSRLLPLYIVRFLHQTTTIWFLVV